MKKKTLTTSALIVFMALSTVTVTAAELPSGEERFPAGSKLGFSTPTLASEFFLGLDEEIHEIFEENGYEVVTISYEGNAAQQVADMENLANMGCDAITLFTMDETAISDICKKFEDEGINIYPNALFKDPETYTFCLSQDEFAVGQATAQLAVDWIEKTFPDAEDGSVEVCVVSTTMTEAIIENTNGMIETLESCPKVKIDEVFDAADAMDPNSKTQEFADIATAKYPNCKVFVTYGDEYAYGVCEVYNRIPDLDREHFGVFTAGNSQLLLNMIKDSETNDSLIRGTYAPSGSTAEHIYKVVTGAYDDIADENSYIFTPGEPITANNVDEYLTAE